VSPGDFVIYPADPLLYGRLWIVGVHADGRLECEQIHADKHGEFGRELFDPLELELESVWRRHVEVNV
jgi:hypothetical protein